MAILAQKYKKLKGEIHSISLGDIKSQEWYWHDDVIELVLMFCEEVSGFDFACVLHVLSSNCCRIKWIYRNWNCCWH